MKEARFCKNCSLKTEHEITNYSSANRNPRGFAKYKCNSCGKNSRKRFLRPSSEISY